MLVVDEMAASNNPLGASVSSVGRFRLEGMHCPGMRKSPLNNVRGLIDGVISEK